MKQFRQSPEIRVKNGIAACHIKIRLTTKLFTQTLRLIDDVQHVLPRHALEPLAGSVREDIAMLAALIAFVGDVPLECERRRFSHIYHFFS